MATGAPARRDKQIVRVLTLLRTLKEGGRPSIHTLAARFHTRRETIYRDLVEAIVARRRCFARYQAPGAPAPRRSRRPPGRRGPVSIGALRSGPPTPLIAPRVSRRDPSCICVRIRVHFL